MKVVDIEYPEDMTENYAGLVIKYKKNLSSLLQGCKDTGRIALGNFVHTVQPKG
jgi:hypothetical protein